MLTPAAKQPQTHQPQAFIPASARRNETPTGLFDLGQRRSSERQQQQQQQQHGAYEAQRKAEAYSYQDDYQGNHRANHLEEHQGNHRGNLQQNQIAMGINQTNSLRRHPAISPDQQALLTGVVNRHSYSSRQPLGMSTSNSNIGGESRAPLLNNAKSYTDIRALNDSGFGMKVPVANLKAVVENHRYQQQPTANRQRADNRNAQIMNSNIQDKNRTGSYADRVMALQGRVPTGGQQQVGGGAGSMLRSELALALSLRTEFFAADCR
jgi:hypothetical protein